MKKFKTQKGITLIALVATVLILLILAAVAIFSVTNHGIIEHANNAATLYNQSAKDEANIMNGLNENDMQKPYAPTEIIVKKVLVGSITVQATGGMTKDGTGVKYQYSLDGMNWSSTISAGNDYKFSNLSAEAKTYTVYARSVDSEDMTSESITKQIKTLQGIEFKVDGTQYYSVSGWNWYEWCKSEYNSIYSCKGLNQVVTANAEVNFVYKPSSTVKVMGSDIIESVNYERTYYLPSMPF